MKTCNRCFIEKDFLDFSKASTCKDGYRNYCKVCQQLKKQEWYYLNKEHVLNKTKQWKQTNPDKRKAISTKWAQANKEYQATYKKKYREANKELSRAWVSARKKKVKQNTPIWANVKEIVSFYKDRPIGYHVDHIIPLNGKNVSGLHVIENLQYLPAKENMVKRNNYEVI